MSFLEGETNISPFAIYKEITEEKFNKMNEKIKQYEQAGKQPQKQPFR